MMNRKITQVLALVIAVALLGEAYAGDIEPPGPPSQTMVTLQEIYDMLDGCAEACGVSKTGQIGCWDTSGAAVACAGTGQDGEYQAGNSAFPRFTVNSDGTVTDNLTGLTWLQDTDCFGLQTWTAAFSVAGTLADGSCGLTDGSVAGDWRLPNIRELRSIFDYSQSDPALPPGHPFIWVPSTLWWSSTTYYINPSSAWHVSLVTGSVGYGSKVGTERHVWPVRGGS